MVASRGFAAHSSGGGTSPSLGAMWATAALIYAQLQKPFICKGLDHITKIKMDRITTPKTEKARTIRELLTEARQKSGAEKLTGMTLWLWGVLLPIPTT